MIDILLATINAKYVHPSLALRLLRANLGDLEERSAIVEFALRQPLEEKVDSILAARPRVLALSVSIWNHEQTLELLLALGERWSGFSADAAPRPAIVLGGPEAANLPADSALLRPPVMTPDDYLVRGEGEVAFAELCRAVLSGTVPERSAAVAALRPLSDGGPTVMEAAPVDPARIDPGYRLYSDEDLARKLSYVEASRGCPFGCEFCLSSLDRHVREFPLDAFLGNLDSLISRGAKAFKFLDRTFNLDDRRAGAIIDFFLARLNGDSSAPQAAQGTYVHFEMVPARFPAVLREKLARFPAGSLRLEVGIQTFNKEVAELIGRASDPEKELEALRFLRDRTNAVVHADLIAGLPGETLESFARGFDLLWETRPGEIQLGILKRLPGAPIARRDREYGMSYAAGPPYEVISTSAMTEAELERVKTFARFWELIVNRGRFDADLDRLLPRGEPAFARFSALSERLFSRFGRSWGIPLAELRAELEAFNANVGEEAVGAVVRAARTIAKANAGLNFRNVRARSDTAIAIAETAEFLESNAKELNALDIGTKERGLVSLADAAAKICVESILSVDQYAELSASVMIRLRDLYASFLKAILAAARSGEASSVFLPPLVDEHRLRMAAVLSGVDGLLPDADTLRRDTVRCAEYTAALQAEILGLEGEPPLEPILDLGCGREARLVRFLRSAGYSAYGLERLDPAESAMDLKPFLRQGDWMDYDLGAGEWGTILSHLAFSNHLVHHASRGSGRDIAYVRRYRRLLDALKPGGAFRYAPSVPFLEKHLDRGRFDIEIRNIGPAGFPFCATTVRMLKIDAART